MVNPHSRHVRLRVKAALASTSSALAGFLILGAVHAQTPGPGAGTAPSLPQSLSPKQTLQLISGKWGMLSLEDDFDRVSIGDPETVDVTMVRPRELYVVGKKAGATNLFVWTKKGRVSLHEVVVGADTWGLQKKLRELLPDEPITVHSAGATLVLSGMLSDSQKVHQAMSIAEHYTGRSVINMLGLTDTPQVLLEVKVAEVSKRLTDKLGAQIGITGARGDFSYSMLGSFLVGGAASIPAGTGGAVRLNDGADSLSLEAEIKNGLIKILAEPNIIALSGEEGSFLAGGKVFIPVPRSGDSGVFSIGLEEREYGVGLKFLPTVLSGGRIHLKVTPEVSELAPEGSSVRVGSVVNVLPTISTRRASTTVQLRDGQTFAIGGLIKNNVVESVSAIPLLGEIPILGALFRSSEFISDRSELMFIVTPRLVRPLNDRVSVPTDSYQVPSRAEYLFGAGPNNRPPPTTPNTTPATDTPSASQP
jgi:pilus assembly protein CpaC